MQNFNHHSMFSKEPFKETPTRSRNAIIDTTKCIEVRALIEST